MIRHQNFEIPGVWARDSLSGQWSVATDAAGTWSRPEIVGGVWRRIPGSVAELPTQDPWLLASGAWSDAGAWRDTDTWRDAA